MSIINHIHYRVTKAGKTEVMRKKFRLLVYPEGRVSSLPSTFPVPPVLKVRSEQDSGAIHPSQEQILTPIPGVTI